MTKEAYWIGLQEIVTDPLYLANSDHDLPREIQENMWSLSLSQSLAAMFQPAEIKGFLYQVRQNRHWQLKQQDRPLELYYYLWYDEQAGQLRFNFITTRTATLPFSATIEVSETEEEIIAIFLQASQKAEEEELLPPIAAEGAPQQATSNKVKVFVGIITTLAPII
ncbi:MAG: hypothetical protein EOO61_14520 [Hymenobacter sp.]|nr:MAG: hypothetical protein EOO61_14520 [Hymenobacter sp.]